MSIETTATGQIANAAGADPETKLAVNLATQLYLQIAKIYDLPTAQSLLNGLFPSLGPSIIAGLTTGATAAGVSAGIGVGSGYAAYSAGSGVAAAAAGAGAGVGSAAPMLAASYIGAAVAVASIVAGYFGQQARMHMLEDLHQAARHATYAGVKSAPIVAQLVVKAKQGDLSEVDLVHLTSNLDNMYKAVGARGDYRGYAMSLAGDPGPAESGAENIAKASPQFINFTGQSWRGLQPTSAWAPTEHQVGIDQWIIPNNRTSYERYHPVNSDWEAWTERYPSMEPGSTRVDRSSTHPNPIQQMNAYQGVLPTADELRNMRTYGSIQNVQRDPSAYGLPKNAWYYRNPNPQVGDPVPGYWTTDPYPNFEPNQHGMWGMENPNWSTWNDLSPEVKASGPKRPPPPAQTNLGTVEDVQMGPGPERWISRGPGMTVENPEYTKWAAAHPPARYDFKDFVEPQPRGVATLWDKQTLGTLAKQPGLDSGISSLFDKFPTKTAGDAATWLGNQDTLPDQLVAKYGANTQTAWQAATPEQRLAASQQYFKDPVNFGRV